MSPPPVVRIDRVRMFETRSGLSLIAKAAAAAWQGV